MTRDEFDAVMLVLSLGIGKVTPGDQLDVYWHLVQEDPWIDCPIFLEAAHRALRGLETNFLPPYGVLYRHACDIALKRRGEQERLSRLQDDRRHLLYSPEVQRLLKGIGRRPSSKDTDV